MGCPLIRWFVLLARFGHGLSFVYFISGSSLALDREFLFF
jgi:hypothetical protein